MWRESLNNQAMMKFVAIAGISSIAIVSQASRPAAPVTKAMAGASARPNPIANTELYVDPNSNAWKTAHEWRKSRPDAAAALERIARQPRASWINEWAGDPRRAVDRIADRITGAGALPVFVAYNIPNRDCGSYSAGGSADASKYRKWISGFAAGLAGRKSIVILEPDALAGMSCLPERAQQERMGLIRDAVKTLKSAGAAVYIDAGHPRWQSASTMAARLNRSGIDAADGFALNVSNFQTTSANVAYGKQISRAVGGKHFVIDTSRNGAGSNGEWCNPRGRALGENPTVHTGDGSVDAFLWVKVPGESDGSCAGAPAAGKWWPEYAVGLAERQSTRLAGL